MRRFVKSERTQSLKSLVAQFLLITLAMTGARAVHAEPVLLKNRRLTPPAEACAPGRIPALPELPAAAKVLLDHQALEAASVVYSLPELETTSTSDELIAKYQQFVRRLPQGYWLFHADSFPASGLKFMILAPHSLDDSLPWVLSIAGTETAIDWLSDAGLGRNQLEDLKRMVLAFSGCKHQDRAGKPLPARRLLVTGHSLGGGLAQALAYHITRRRLAEGMPTENLRLVTWNAFGARELIEREGGFIPGVADRMESAHYFITGDPVSRIGTHLGPTFELRPAPYLLRGNSLGDLAALHSIRMVEESAGHGGLSGAWRSEPPAAGAIDALARYAGVLSKLPKAVHVIRRSRLMTLVCEALEKLARQKNARASADVAVLRSTLEVREYLRQLCRSMIWELEQQRRRVSLSAVESLLLDRLKRAESLR